MKQLFAAIGALALGATAMYYLDPQQGRRRRALVGDKVDRVSHDARHYVQSRRKRVSDRIQGLLARVRGRFGSKAPDDQQLLGHVRSRLGRAVSYPHAVETDVQQGRVVLRGHVLESEFNMLMGEVWSIPGVVAVDSQLSFHAEPGNVPGLQGRPHRTGRARMRQFARNTASTLAIAGGLGAGLKALQAKRGGASAGGMLSLAIPLLVYGMGDGARRLARRRGGRPLGRRAMMATETSAEKMHEPAASAQSGLPLAAAWR